MQECTSARTLEKREVIKVEHEFANEVVYRGIVARPILTANISTRRIEVIQPIMLTIEMPEPYKEWNEIYRRMA